MNKLHILISLKPFKIIGKVNYLLNTSTRVNTKVY